jgi:hypothetical protein
VDVGQEAAILPLRVWGHVEQGMEEAPGVVYPGDGFKGVGRFKVCILWESFGFLRRLYKKN